MLELATQYVSLDSPMGNRVCGNCVTLEMRIQNTLACSLQDQCVARCIVVVESNPSIHKFVPVKRDRKHRINRAPYTTRHGEQADDHDQDRPTGHWNWNRFSHGQPEKRVEQASILAAASCCWELHTLRTFQSHSFCCQASSRRRHHTRLRLPHGHIRARACIQADYS